MCTHLYTVVTLKPVELCVNDSGSAALTIFQTGMNFPPQKIGKYLVDLSTRAYERHPQGTLVTKEEHYGFPGLPLVSVIPIFYR